MAMGIGGEEARVKDEYGEITDKKLMGPFWTILAIFTLFWDQRSREELCAEVGGPHGGVALVRAVVADWHGVGVLKTLN